MFRVVILTTIWIAMASVAQAQWVSSGSGVGAREGDQGLTSPDNLAQSLGYDDSADMEEAAAMGYESNSADAEAWGYATNDNFDEDCVRLFGTNCEEVDASEFRPIVPQIITCIDFGFVNLTEMDAFVDAVSVYGGDENDAANCKRRDYSDTDADGQLCMMATNDSDNASACRAALGVSESSSQDCSDMDRDDYENLANNMPPRIVTPADWTPTEIPNTAGPGDAVISILRATDPDEDPLTWSITSMEFDVFSINAETGIVTIADGSNAPETQPDSISLTVQVSDGELTDNLTVRIDLQDPNRPPQIVLPADWVPSIVAHDAAQGASLIDVLAATDPDDDALTWSISASDMDIFSIDAQSGVLTLAREDGLAGLEARPENISVTVQVSDGQLTDEQALVIPLEAEKINNPPEIIVPEGFAENEFNPYANTTMVGTLKGRDPDGDTLTWSLIDGSPEVFNINAQTGAISYTGLGLSRCKKSHRFAR